jgi:hypothetical protein
MAAPDIIFVEADATAGGASAPFFDCAAAAAEPIDSINSNKSAAAKSAAEAEPAPPPARRLAAEAEAALALSGLPAPLGPIAVVNPWDDLLHLTPQEAERARQEARRLVALAAGGGGLSSSSSSSSSPPSPAQRSAALEVAIARADAALDEDGECLAALWARARALLAHGAAHAAVVDLRRLTAVLPPVPEQWPEGLDALLRDAHTASRPEGFVMREHMAAFAKGAAARAAIAEAVKGRREALEQRGGVKWAPPPAAGPSVLLHPSAGAALDARGAAAALAVALGGVERPHLLALGLGEGATDQEVRAAFHAYARALHPDKQKARGLPSSSAVSGEGEGGAKGLAPPPPRGSATTFEEAQEAYEAIGRLRGGLGM